MFTVIKLTKFTDKDTLPMGEPVAYRLMSMESAEEALKTVRAEEKPGVSEVLAQIWEVSGDPELIISKTVWKENMAQVLEFKRRA